jgi:hypothetical protein
VRTPRTHYYLDCDRGDPGCDFDLDVYQNANFSDAALAELNAQMRDQLLPWGGSSARTHTLANLLAGWMRCGSSAPRCSGWRSACPSAIT